MSTSVQQPRTCSRSSEAALPDLKALLEKCSSHWGYEDPVYRFYHHSVKVFHLQATTTEIVTALQALALGRALNKQFMRIIRGGTGKTFEYKHNAVWLKTTRPIVEAFFHARFSSRWPSATVRGWSHHRTSSRADGPLSSISTICAEDVCVARRRAPSARRRKQKVRARRRSFRANGPRRASQPLRVRRGPRPPWREPAKS
jgi:hypothetical protein